MSHLPTGTLLQGGKYRIEGVLGQGGFGITYRAKQVMLDRTVAIKEFFMKDFNLREGTRVTTPPTGNGRQVEQYRLKFVKEARNLAGLEHPHIVSIIDIFEENGTVYYVMPHLSGGSLLDVVKRVGALDEGKALGYVSQVGAALSYMHKEKHLCHYDVKPANILLDGTGNAVLIDFGISKNYDSSGRETSTTPIGMSEGYAPIEQYQGQVQDFSPESDVYALGATLCYLLSAQRPPTAIDRISGAPLPLPPTITAATRQLVEQAMAIARQNRPQSVEVFLSTEPQKRPVVKTDDDVTVVAAPKSEPLRDRTFTVRGVSFKMVAVEGGTFTMGATTEQVSDAYDDEKPAHKVTLSSFSIGATEVTQELWKAVMGNNPSRFTGNLQRPVEQVSWNDYQVFINKLNALTGERFRLPTEAEWEYAARGGNRSKGYRYSGSNDIDSVAWYWRNSGNTWGFFEKTHPVATKIPNELGLYDMSGNVWEWCSDWYESSYYSSSPSTNPTGLSSGSRRVARGGSWNNYARNCRVSFRYFNSADFRYYYLGLRLAL